MNSVVFVRALLTCLAAKELTAGTTQLQLPLQFEPFGSSYIARTNRGSVVVSNTGLALQAGRSVERVELLWVAASPGRLEAEALTSGVVNYLAGDDPQRWLVGVPQYARVRARGLYDGVEIIYHSRAASFEFDLVVHPYASVEPLKLAVSPPYRIEVSKGGGFMVRTAAATYHFGRPDAYQLVNGARIPVQCEYAIDAEGAINFRPGRYDTRRELVIDPVVEFMSYLGGAGIDHIHAAATDAEGNVILAGITNSVNFPLSGARTENAMSIFVTKLNPTGSAVLFTTILGTRPNARAAIPLESVNSIATGPDGYIYVSGTTLAQDFPTTPGAWRRTASGGFAAKLDSSGNLVYSTFVGPFEWGLQVQRIRERGGVLYVAGTAGRPEFLGTPGAFQRDIAGDTDLFVLALAPDGSAPLFATALGSPGRDVLSDMLLDREGNVVLAGTTSSKNFPRTDDALPYPGPGENQVAAVLATLDSGGAQLLYSTFLGTASITGLLVLPDGDYVIAGTSALPEDWIDAEKRSSIRFPINRLAAYVARLSQSSKRPVWSTDMQCLSSLFGRGITSDEGGNLYWTEYPLWPSGGSVGRFDGQAVYKLSPDGTRLLYSSPLPGGTVTTPVHIGGGRLLVAGRTTASDLPTTPGSVQPQRDPAPPGTLQFPLNYDDGFIALLDLSGFTAGNFFAAPPNRGITWRIGTPLPEPISVPIVVSGDPGPITVTPSARLSATYTSSPSPSVLINANSSRISSGEFRETITLSADNPESRLTLPVFISVLPRVSFDVATTQVQIRLRQGQDRSTVRLPSVAITADFAGAYFNFDVESSDRNWLFGSVSSTDGRSYSLSINVGEREPGTYQGTLTIRLSGIPNLERTVRVLYQVDPPATIQLSTTTIRLHVVKGQPVTPAVVRVTGSVPSVSWGIFIGVSRTWLQANVSGSTTPGEIRITVDPEAVEVGYWTITMWVNGEAGQRIQATILIDVSSGAVFDLLPASIDYQFTRGGPYLQTSQMVTFVAPNPVTVQWSADQPWVTPQQGSGITPFSVYLAFDSRLPEGVYKGFLTARAAGSNQQVPLTWRLFDVPRLVFSTAPISFTYRIGGPSPSAQRIAITSPTLTPGRFEAGPTDFPAFLKIDPAYGLTPATITLTVDPQGRAPGTYRTNLAIRGFYPDTAIYPWIPVTLEVLPDPNRPTASISRTANHASRLSGAISPGEILTITGSGLGPATPIRAEPDAISRYPRTLAGGIFYFDEMPAPILSVGAAEAVVVVPFGIAGRTRTNLTFELEGRRTPPLALTVAASSPGVFTADASGVGLAARNLLADASIDPNAAADPVPRGSILSLFATGLGATIPVLPDGSVLDSASAQLATPVRVLIAGREAALVRAGPNVGLVAGLMRIDVQIPDDVTPGRLPVVVLSGENPSQPGLVVAVQ